MLLTIVLMLIGVIVWLLLDYSVYHGHMPHKLWLAVFSNIFVFAVGYILSRVLKKGC
jgi:hypothetical protein